MNELLTIQQTADLTNKVLKFLSHKGVINVEVCNPRHVRWIYSVLSGAIRQKIKKEEIANLINAKQTVESLTEVEAVTSKHTVDDLMTHISQKNIGFLFIDQTFFFHGVDSLGKYQGSSDPIPEFGRFLNFFNNDQINCLNTIIYIYLKNDKNLSTKNEDLGLITTNLENTFHLDIKVTPNSILIQNDSVKSEYKYVLE